MPEFATSVLLEAAPEAVFQFLTQTANHERIAPPELDLVFVTPHATLKQGARFTFRVQAYGQIQQIEHVISRFDAPYSFREESVKGPLPRWVQDYELELVGTNHTKFTTRIEFDPPKGLLGLLLTSQKIVDSLEDGFTHRCNCLIDEFGGRILEMGSRGG